MAVLLFFLAIAAPAVLLVLATRQQKKRGCGRGCATCGNREICHPGEKRRAHAGKKEESGDHPAG